MGVSYTCRPPILIYIYILNFSPSTETHLEESIAEYNKDCDLPRTAVQVTAPGLNGGRGRVFSRCFACPRAC